jgi:HK97 family phage major capsid protein
MDDEQLVAFGEAVKALGDGKIGGYLIRFSKAAEPDLEQDYFDAETEIHTPETLPVLYNHGMDETMKKTIIGHGTTRADDVGLWLESQLNMRSEYEKAIYEMAKNGKLGYSSGALSHLVEREPVGKSFHIKTWFVGEASLTPIPAEPRNTVVALKSLLPSDAALPDTDEDEPIMETKSMEEKDIKALTEQAIADALKKRDEQAAAEAEAKATREAEVKAAEEAAYNKAVEDMKALKPNRYHSTEPIEDDNDGVKAFKAWMQTGQVNQGLIVPDEHAWKVTDMSAKAAWNVTTGATGGYLVPDPLYNQIIAKRDIASWVRQAPVQSFQTSADHLLVPVEDTSLTDFVLTAEAGAYDEEEATVAQVDLIQYKYTKLTKVSEEFLMYNQTNFDSWFAESLGRAVAGTENEIFTDGTGTTVPLGVLAGATVANTCATADVITPQELATLIGYLNGGYNVVSECRMLMSNTTYWYLRATSGTSSAPMPFAFIPTPAGGEFFGYQTILDDDLTAYTSAAAKCVVFGNMTYYGIVEKPGIMVQRNPYLYMANGQVGIFSSIFRGGSPLQSEAFYYLTAGS